MLERFGESDPALAVELVGAALARAGSAGAEGGSAEGPSPVEALALELAGDDRLMEAAAEDGGGLVAELRSLLWNHGVQRLGAGDFHTALAFFTAAAPLLGGGGGTDPKTSDGGAPPAEQPVGPSPAECCRAQALCCLGAGEPDRCGWGGCVGRQRDGKGRAGCCLLRVTCPASTACPPSSPPLTHQGAALPGRR